jgi:ATP-dependent Clp protease ATP-binding subunit ClpB
VRQKPYAVVLFDEVEKAHPEVMNLLLQVLDEGHLTDSQGRKVDFKNTLILMSSNLGSEEIQRYPEDPALQRETVQGALRSHFRPELLNRLDETLIFNPLDRFALRRIVEIQLKRLKARLSEQGLALTLTEAAQDQLAEMGFDPLYGARPLKRALRRYVEDPLAQTLLSMSAEEHEVNDRCIVDWSEEEGWATQLVADN